MNLAIRSEIVLMPFFVADAWVERLSAVFDEPELKPIPINTKRTQLSAGSARIDITFRQKKVGWFVVSAGSEKITFLEAYTAPEQPAGQELMPLLFNLFWISLKRVVEETGKSEATFNLLTEIINQARTLAESGKQQLTADLRQRRGGAPTNEANDWARAQIAAGKPRNKVYLEWLRMRGEDATDPIVQDRWRDAFRKAIARKGRTDET